MVSRFLKLNCANCSRRMLTVRWDARSCLRSVRKAITEDDRVKPDYARIRVPVLAIFRTAGPFEEVTREFPPRNESERAALTQHYEANRAMLSRWQRDLLAGVPTARIIELPRANLFMFLSNETDVLREVRRFVSGLAAQ